MIARKFQEIWRLRLQLIFKKPCMHHSKRISGYSFSRMLRVNLFCNRIKLPTDPLTSVFIFQRCLYIMSFHNVSVTNPSFYQQFSFNTSRRMHAVLRLFCQGLCWRRMLQAKCSPALWVTESKEAPRHWGFSVFSPFVSQSVLEQCRSAGGWLGGLLEQLIPDNVRSSHLWKTPPLGSEVPLTLKSTICSCFQSLLCREKKL